ncbi:MAG: glycosyltransferase family 39 protein [Phycisphaeraceae bacterium]|nr:glycosyltransferase family 39 protein [Phycisphaeraceae bacterium]
MHPHAPQAAIFEPPPAGHGTGLAGGLCVFLAGLAAWLVHFTAPRDDIDDDQLKPFGYVYDIVHHGRFLAPRDFEGVVNSKPPLYPWLASLVSLFTGNIGGFELYLPTGAAMIGCGMLCWWWARSRFGEAAGVGAGLAMVLSTLTLKHACLARTDALFTFMVCAAAMAAYSAWRTGMLNPARATRAWTVFYIIATAATLTKGPLGAILAALGLMAALWERREGRAYPVRGSHVWGVLIFVTVSGGWLLGAYWQAGQEVIDIVIGRELVGHATRARGDKVPFMNFYEPPLLFISRYVPWSIPALFGLWRVLRRPSEGEEARLGERFVFCWFVCGMFIFCAAPHQRSDLLMPLIPAAAILAGREAAVWTRRMSRTPRIVAAATASVAVLVGCGVWHHKGRLRDKDVIETHAALALAEGVSPVLRVTGARLEFLRESWEVQFAFRVKQPHVMLAHAEALLASEERVVIIARVNEEIDAALTGAGGRLIALEDPLVRPPMAAYANFTP